ncbi:hypothetical protein K1T71_009877 [Dendrolimus kikuchii]|uniref:Uncharacterized protein n=1 Tax=Dendrolimus kikuchii TaxID=765133 RepID=A0ACC1CSY4_9NEOP|nr:hypothetical protein K1T71_009877 [Dendrolimus kikuchii]
MIEKNHHEDSICDLQFKFNCLYQQHSRIRNIRFRKIFLTIILILIITLFHFNNRNELTIKKQLKHFDTKNYNLTNVSLAITTYSWFTSRLKFFYNHGDIDEPKYVKDTPMCSLNLSILELLKYIKILGPKNVNKSAIRFEWLEKQFPEVKSGGFHAPEHCRARHRVAILIPFRNRGTNLAILLYHLHPFLQKQLLAYRIFVIEQVGTDSFNKGALYNIGFLESQRYGRDWQCYIFHDVDLLPMDERILYSCPRKPTHMSAAVESHGYDNLSADSDKFRHRLQAKRLPMLRYNKSIARYAALPHEKNIINDKRYAALYSAKKRFRKEGLRTVRYLLIGVIKRTLFTHILADVNPDKYMIKNQTLPVVI